MTVVRSVRLLLVRDEEVVAMLLGTVEQSDRPRAEVVEGKVLAVEPLDPDVHYTFVSSPSRALFADHVWVASHSPCAVFENGAHYYEEASFHVSLLPNPGRADGV